MKMFTVGYGGRKPQEFVELLKAHGVRTVIDVRLRPDRACMPVWARANTPGKGIEALLSKGSIGYVSMVQLGNLFSAQADWREVYRKFLDRCGEMLFRGIESVDKPYCLLCAEKRHTECHRAIVAEWLVTQAGEQFEHIE